MKSLLKMINPFRSTNSRFERYYSGVVGNGSGYPTADEARKDLRRYDQSYVGFNPWTR